MSWFSYLLNLFFPKRCAACNKLLLSNEEVLCVKCRASMPLTHYWNIEKNYLCDLFAGRALIYNASALFYYQYHSDWRKVLHVMKYNNQYFVADTLGQIYGHYLKNSQFYKDVEVILPVPLHKKRYASRGYNQSEVFAKGIAKQTGWEVVANALVRTRNTPKQALKQNANQRWENVEGAFKLAKPDIIRNKKIIIVDDVITTGATIEACTRAINKELPDMRFYIGAIACVRKWSR